MSDHAYIGAPADPNKHNLYRALCKCGYKTRHYTRKMTAQQHLQHDHLALHTRRRRRATLTTFDPANPNRIKPTKPTPKKRTAQ